MNRIFRNIKLVFLVLSILLCLAIPVVSLISTALNWHGDCNFALAYTFGQPCTWWQFAGLEMLSVSFFAIPVLFLTLLVWLGIMVVQFFVARNKKTV